MRVQEITNSEMGTFRMCRKRHGFEYVDMLRPKLPGRQLTWGNCIHAGCESGYRAAYQLGVSIAGRLDHALVAGAEGVRDFHAVYVTGLDGLVREGHIGDEEAQEHFDDAAKMLDVALWAVDHFFRATQEDLETLVLLGAEVSMHEPMVNKAGRVMNVRLAGVADTVWWDPQDRSIIVDDHKTVDELVGTTEKRIALDPQMSGYMHGVQRMVRAGKLRPLDGSELPEGAADRIGRCRYNCIRRSRPKQPKVNKVRKNDGAHEQTAILATLEVGGLSSQGLVSTAAIDTTAEIYDAALAQQTEERGLPMTEKQGDLLVKLRDQGDRYFARFEFWRNAAEREEWRRETIAEARLMRMVERDPSLRTRNTGACSRPGSPPCAFRAVCINDQPETRALYRIATKRHEEVR